MNNISQDPTKQTSCKNCIFAVYEDQTQIGCLHNRIDKFKPDVIEAYDHEKEFYVVDRICSTFRNNRWNNANPDIIKCRNESCVSFDLLIDVNNIDQEYFDILIAELNRISYPELKYKLVFMHGSGLNKISKKYISKLHSFFPESTISVYFIKNEYLDAFTLKSKNTFHVILNKENISNINNAMSKIEFVINDELKKIILSEYDNKTFISNLVCRYVYPNLYLDYSRNLTELKNNAIKQNLYIKL